MKQDLAALVGSRICHDLISPIGAIGNGLELMSLSQNKTNGDEIAMVTASAASASARVQFFRVVYGISSADQMMSATSIQNILTANATETRFEYEWRSPENVDRNDVRLCFLAIQCLETAAPMGGTISVVKENDQWSAVLESKSALKIDNALWSSLIEPDDDFQFTAVQVQFALLPRAAKEANRTLQIDFTDNVKLSF